MAWKYDWYYFPPSRPREAKGGIKAQSKRGAFGESWWAKRWIEVLESFNIGARLDRGRSYARRGQVLSIDIKKGTVTAKVQGSRSRPYQVKIRVNTLTRTAWKKLAKALSRQAIFAAKLLAGKMPENIEDAFKSVGLSLFPSRLLDLHTDCSCPDWSNPCKHIAAVYYLLGEEFDRDPFLIFKLRGMEWEELITLAYGQSAKRSKTGRDETTSASSVPQEEEPLLPPEPLPSEPEAFWGQGGVEGEVDGEVRIPPVSAALPKRLGNFPFWRSRESFLSALEEIYREASPAGLNVFLGEQGLARND